VYERLSNLKKGEPRWVRVHLVPDIGADGEVNGVYSLVIDVHEDHQLRIELGRQEGAAALLRREHPRPDRRGGCGPELRLRRTRASSACAGMRPEEIVVRPVREVLGDEGIRALRRALSRAPAARRGRAATSAPSARPAPSRAGTSCASCRSWARAPVFQGYYVVGSDIHDIKLAEDRLRESEAQLRLYTDNIPDAVAVPGPQSRHPLREQALSPSSAASPPRR
jgi:PAS domain-containing protein